MDNYRLIFLLLLIAISFNILIAKTYKYNAVFTRSDVAVDPLSANFSIYIENRTLLNVDGDIFEKIPDPVFRVKISYDNNHGKKATFIDREMSFCTIGTILTINPLTKPVVDLLREGSNWNFSCPVIAGHYYTKNLEVNHYSEIAFPPAAFKVELEMKNKLKQTLKNIFKLTIDGIYEHN